MVQIIFHEMKVKLFVNMRIQCSELLGNFGLTQQKLYYQQLKFKV